LRFFGKMPSWFFPMVLLCASAVLVYSNTLRSPFHFDDFSSIVWNGPVHDLANLKAIWQYSPSRVVTYTSFAANYAIGLLDVTGYHIVNLVIHVGAGLSAWWLVLLLFRAPGLRDTPLARDSRILAFFTALLFLVHPLQTQAVTYIVQRAASMATAFYLLAMALYVKTRLLQMEGRTRITLLAFAGALLASLFAMFSKETAFTIPVMVVLLETSFLGGREGRKSKIFVGLTALLFGVFALALLVRIIPIPDVPNISPGQYLITQFRVLITYLRLVLLPVNQNLDYDYPISKGFFELETALSFVLLVALLGFAVWLFRRQRILSVAILWFFVTLAPESSIIPIPDVIYEHRMYLPMFGCCLFMVTAIYTVLSRKPRLVLLTALSVISFGYAFAAYTRNKVWRDELVLTSDVIDKSPRKARAYNSRGLIYINRGDYTRALVDLDKALSLDSLFLDSYLNRGTAYALKGERDRALRDFNRGAEIDSLDLRPLTNRANLYMDLGQYDEALNNLNRSLALQSNNAIIYLNRGLVYYRIGDFQKALQDYDHALRLNPGLVEGYYNRALAYHKMGRNDLAQQDVRQIQRLGYRVSVELLDLLRSK